MFRLSATADVERPVHVRVTLPEGYGYDLLPGDFELVDGGDDLWLRSPPVAGDSIDVTYERLP